MERESGEQHRNSRDRPQIEREEEHKTQEMTAVGAHVVYEAIKREGEEELARTTTGLTFSGLAAGLSMGFSFIAEVALKHHLPDAEWTPLITKVGYVVGFVIVIIGRQQLFTENTLTPVIPLLDKQSNVRLSSVLRLWIIVFVANLIGTALFAWTLAWLPVFEAEFRPALHALSIAAYHGGEFGKIFVRAIFAGWLVALMVWLMPNSGTARILVIAVIAYLIGIAEFPHIIAGAVQVLYSVADGSLELGSVAARYLLPTLLGNVLGGVALVAALNFAQVSPDEEGEDMA